MTDEYKLPPWLDDGGLSVAYMERFGEMPIKGKLQDEKTFRQSLRDALRTGIADPWVTWRRRATDEGWTID